MKGWIEVVTYQGRKIIVTGSVLALALLPSLAWAKGPIISATRNLSHAWGIGDIAYAVWMSLLL